MPYIYAPSIPWTSFLEDAYAGDDEQFGGPPAIDSPFHYLTFLPFDTVNLICRFIRISRMEYLVQHVGRILSWVEQDDRSAIVRMHKKQSLLLNH